MPWEIVGRPVGNNTGGKNEGGLVIELRNGNTTEEIGRVAYERTNSLNPTTEFKDQVKIEMTKAKEAVGAINEMLTGAGTLA